MHLLLRLVFFVCSVESGLYAQNLTLLSPSAPVTVAEGEEFSSDVLLDAWDFDHRRDIGWEEGMNENTIQTKDGVWRGNTAVGGAYLFPLFPGLKGVLHAEGSNSESKLPKFGINHRINASKYSWLSFKANFSSRTQIALYWDADDSRPQYWPDTNSPFALLQDGINDHGFYFRNTEWFSYSLDLKNPSSYSQQHRGTWSGQPYAFRIDPSVFTAAGSLYQFDWIRLSDPNSAPFISINWSTAGVPTGAVLFICYIKDGKIDESIPVHHIQSKNISDSFNFPLASLPAGSYQFFVEMRTTLGSTYTGATLRSNLSPAIEIKPRPRAVIQAPSKTSGTEYSISVGNPWDMNALDDIRNLDLSSYSQPFRQFLSPAIVQSPDSIDGGNIFQAVSEAPYPGNSQTDAQIHLAVSKAKPIDSEEFVYLNYRVALDSLGYGDIADKVRKGWVMRPIWWSGSSYPKIFDTAKAHIVYEGWHDYMVDLEDNDTIGTGTPWSSYRFLDNLRLDPLETKLPTWFYVDYVRLYSKNRSGSGEYQIDYDLQSSSSSKVEFFYDTDREGFNGVKIGSSEGVLAGEHSYLWETFDLTKGNSYYIYLIVTDPFGATAVYSDAPVVIGPRIFKARTRLDFDGDAKSDPAVFRPNTNNYYVNSSAKAQSQSYTFGASSFKPIEGDFDGDGISDRAFIAESLGSLFWYVVRSTDGVLYSRVWGVHGDQPVVGDYNGNGRDEIAIYRDGAWFILDENDGAHVKYWGVPTLDKPIVGDFDGDNKVDLAIQRNSDGVWWILYSGFSEGYAETYYSAIQWGLPWINDVPIATDFTGDGRDDLVVWRPGDGNWYTRDIQNGAISIIQWGLPGDEPLGRVDRDGDRNFDQVVFRPSTAMWYFKTKSGFEAVQYGLSNDRIPR